MYVTQLFKYFDFNESMSIVTIAINRATRDLIAFSVMLFVVFLAFAQFCFIIYGTYMRDFHTFGNTLYASLLLFLSG